MKRRFLAVLLVFSLDRQQIQVRRVLRKLLHRRLIFERFEDAARPRLHHPGAGHQWAPTVRCLFGGAPGKECPGVDTPLNVPISGRIGA